MLEENVYKIASRFEQDLTRPKFEGKMLEAKFFRLDPALE